MARPVVDPIETKEIWGGSNETTVLRHPAYAQVSFSHVSGAADLYGSDFTHQNYVTLTVKRSQLHRDLSRDWHYEKEELIEIALSEAQFATLISAPNRSGVPCTLQRFNEATISGLPRRDGTKIHNEEFSEKLINTVRELKQQREAIENTTSKLSKKMQAELLGPINTAIREIELNLPFLVKSFEEHMETNIEKAKIEVNAYVTNTIQRAGLAALQGDLPLIEYDPKKIAP